MQSCLSSVSRRSDKDFHSSSLVTERPCPLFFVTGLIMHWIVQEMAFVDLNEGIATVTSDCHF